ncbi:GNAT family N-acetyltransferase [Candidatus Woesearchaeota archaeon]|nr:GNAT family N-acetyltransferase [Candidatus Woesearchaeota archaeon]
MILRKARKEDFEQYFALKKEFAKIYQKVSRYKINAPTKRQCREEFKSLFKKNILFSVTEENSKLIAYFIGSIIKTRQKDYGYIDDIFVLKKYQNKGISSALKNEFLKFLKKNKIKNCKLEVNPENKKAISVYKKWGFKIDKYRMSIELK